MKSFKIDFFRGELESDERVSNIFKLLVQQGCPVYSIGGYLYEIRELKSRDGFFYGFIAKFRNEDAPHIAKPRGSEREIQMDAEEGLIEKNYFVYEKKLELLIYQSNKFACSAKILAEYLMEFSKEDLYFSPVLQQEPMERLLKGNIRPKKMEVSFARPGTRQLSPDRTGFSDGVMKLLSSSGGSRVNVKITPERNSLLSMSVKDIFRYLIKETPEEVKVARVEVEDQGTFYPIDLIADRLTSRKAVPLEGRYPVSGAIYRALFDAYDEHESILRKVFKD